MNVPKVYLYDFFREDRSLDSLSGLLGKERYEYCKNMKSVKAGFCSAYAFLLLRYALKREFGFSELPLFRYNEHGKPFLDGCEDIFFNISHVGTKVICAVSRSPVGVDIQDKRKLTLHTGSKFLTQNEMNALSDITDEDTLQNELCRIWCIKESYGKYTGKGFSEGFSAFDAEKLMKDGRALCINKNGYYISICGEW